MFDGVWATVSAGFAVVAAAGAYWAFHRSRALLAEAHALHVKIDGLIANLSVASNQLKQLAAVQNQVSLKPPR